MDDQAPTTKPAKKFLMIQVSGEAKRVAKYVDLLEMEIRTTVDFMNAMFHSAEPFTDCPVVTISPVQVE